VYRNLHLVFFISSLLCNPASEQQASLVSLLDVRDLLALRLVSSETKSWLDTVMLGHKSKIFTLTLDEIENTFDRFMDEQKKIPFKTLNFEYMRASSFFSHPLLPSFLQTYGPQIHGIHTSSGFFFHPTAEPEVFPPQKELAFYQGLPNLIHLSLVSLFTSSLEENVPLPTIEEERLSFLPNLQSFSIHFADYGGYDSSEVIRNIDFLRHCPNVRKLTLDDMPLVESVKVLTALGDYFAARNGWKGGAPPTLSIFIQNSIFTKQSRHQHLKKLRRIDEGMVNKLLEELAASDGRILVDNMPITLLDGAVRLFSKQRGKLRSFGKCITSLIGFSDSVYEVKLPNMRKLRLNGELIILGKEREGDYTKTVSWPKLETIKLENVDEYDNDSESDDDDAPAVPVQPAPVKEDLRSYIKKLVFESGLRATVKRLDYEFDLHFFISEEAPHLLRNLPNLTQLTLTFNEEDADSFRCLFRNLPTSSPKLQMLEITTHFPFKDEDFLGMGDDGCCCVPPLLQLSGNCYQ
jgi:Leucine-rich repeat (LRR) protein